MECKGGQKTPVVWLENQVKKYPYHWKTIKKQSKNPYHKVNIIQKFIKQIHIIKLKSSKFDCEHWPKKGPWRTLNHPHRSPQPSASFELLAEEFSCPGLWLPPIKRVTTWGLLMAVYHMNGNWMKSVIFADIWRDLMYWKLKIRSNYQLYRLYITDIFNYLYNMYIYICISNILQYTAYCMSSLSLSLFLSLSLESADLQ